MAWRSHDGEAGGDEAFGDGGDDGGPGAGEGAGRGKDFDADDVVGGDEAAPGGGDVGGAGEIGEAEVEGIGDAVIVGEVGVEEFLALNDDDAGDGIGGVQGKASSASARQPRVKQMSHASRNRAFLDTFVRGCYHHSGCWPKKINKIIFERRNPDFALMAVLVAGCTPAGRACQR